MDDITFVRSHWWLVSEGFSLSTANSDVQKLPATLYHVLQIPLAYAGLKCETGIRRSKHCRASTPISISAMFSQLP